MSIPIQTGMVSVVVASYNHAEYLEERMNSLIAQTYQNLEILVIDDCSTDDSVEILRLYEAHPMVKLIIRKNNGGWVTVSNQGVENSSGEFILFANCDDSCDPRMIERLVEGLQKNPTAGISFCRSLMINEDSEIIGDDFKGRERSFRVRCKNDVLLSQREMSKFLLNSCVIPNLSAALFRRSCYENCGGLTPHYKVCSDWDIFFKIADESDVFYVKEALNNFRQHQTTIRNSTKEKILYEEIISLLLNRIISLDLTFWERIKFRVHVMYLWAIQILNPSFNGILSFGYLFRRVICIDAISIVFLPFALAIRLMQLPLKVVKKIYVRLFCRGKYKIA